MKATLRIILVCLLMLALLTACDVNTPTTNKPTQSPPNSTPTASTPAPTDPKPTEPKPTEPKPTEPKPTDPPHVCQAVSDSYQVNLEGHWQVCECGGQVNYEAHDLVDCICSVCSAEVYFNDFTCETNVLMYNKFYDQILYQRYDAEGNLLSSESAIYNYNEQDILLSEQHFVDGILAEEVTYDIWRNTLTRKEYDAEGKVIYAERNEPVCDDNGQLVSTKQYINEVLTYEATYQLDEFGFSSVATDTYYLEDGTKEERTYNANGETLTEKFYDAQGNLTEDYSYQHEYQDGNLSKVQCMLNGKLHYIEEYRLVYPFGDDYCVPALSKRTDYRPDGAYSVTTYDEDGWELTYDCFNADGSPLDLSGKFNSAACAPLVGTWTGTITMDAEDLELEGMDISLNASVTIIFDAEGTALIIMDLDKDAYRQLAITMMKELFLSMFGEDMTPEELDAMFQAEYGMGFDEFIEAQVDSSDLTSETHTEYPCVYYVEDGMLYTADDWNKFADGASFTLADDTMTLTIPDFGKPMTLTKDATAGKPIDPPEDLKAHTKFDKTACAPLFGVWEISQTQSTKDMGLELDQHITVTMTVRITFTEDGVQVMQMITDEDAYYQFMLVVAMENIYMKMTADGTTRAEVDAALAQTGSSVKKMAEEDLSTRKLLPDDGYFWFYVEDGKLYYGRDDDLVEIIRITVTETSLIFHAEEGGEDQTFTKKS